MVVDGEKEEDATIIENKSRDDDNDHHHHAVLSSYGDEDKRRYHPLISTFLMMIVYGIYICSSMLPLLAILFAVLVYGEIIPIVVVKILSAFIALDFVIPLSDSTKPDPRAKLRLEQIFSEGSQHYYPARSIFLPNVDVLKKNQDRSYILAAWPHGLMGGGTHVGFLEFSERAGIFPLYSGASVMRYVPFVRRFFSIAGFTDVSKSGLTKALDTKKYGSKFPYNVVHLVVGGINEMFYTTQSDNNNDNYNNNEQIIIRKRKGFVKLAIRTGSDLIPMYTFGANQTYSRLLGRNSLFCKLSSMLQISLVVWLGRFNIPMGFVPHRIPLLGVIGPVVEVPKITNEDDITDELVHRTHEKFCYELKRLFDEYKIVYVEQMGADSSWLTKELKFEDE